MSARCVLVVAIAAVVTAAAPAPVAADDGGATYHVDGQADAGAADPKTAALDSAFAAATREALADLVAPAELKAHKADVDRELVGRARKWVVSYKVNSDATEGDVRKLEVAVRIDVGKVTARLAELGVAVTDTTPDPVVDPPPTTGDGGRGKKATVLLKVTAAKQTTASYGAAAERDVPGLAPLSAAVRGAGWQLISAPASGPRAEADGFLDDDSARALAASAGAELAVIVAIEAPGAAPVRGSADVGALARARIRIIDRDGVLVGEGTALAGAHGTDDGVIGAAITAAATDAFSDAHPATAGGGSSGGGPIAPVAVGSDDVLIRITARDRKESPAWAMVRAIRDKVAATKGAEVAIRRLSGREVVLGVRGGDRGADKIARDIRDLERKIADSSFSAKADGNVVEAKVSGSP